MNIRRTAILWGAALLLLLAAPDAVRGAEDPDPFAGKTLDEIRKLTEKRMEDRKKDQKFFSDYTTFTKKKRSSIERRGRQLAGAARIAGEYHVAEHHFRYGDYMPSIEWLRRCEKKARSTRRRNRYLIVECWLLIAVNWAYLDKPDDQVSAMKKAKIDGAIMQSYKIVQRKLAEFHTLRRELKSLVRKRNLSPRGGKVPGDLQWNVCLQYEKRIFLPVEEYVELSWMIQAFPGHPKVKSGDAAWALLRCHQKLLDYRNVEKLCASFKRDHATHWALQIGDGYWELALAQYGRGSLKDAKRNAELLLRKHPKHPNVENRRVKTLIAECENTPPAKDRFAMGNPYNRWYGW